MIKATHTLTKLNHASSSKARWVGTMLPRKQTDDNGGKATMEKGETGPIVAFSRSPPNPPLLGPLVALFLLELWYKKDNNDE